MNDHHHKIDKPEHTGLWSMLFVIAAILAFGFFVSARQLNLRLHTARVAFNAQLAIIQDLEQNAQELQKAIDAKNAELDVAYAAVGELDKQIEALTGEIESERVEARGKLQSARERIEHLEHHIADLGKKLERCHKELSEANQFGPPTPIAPPDVVPSPVPDVPPPAPETILTEPASKPGCQCGCGKAECHCGRCRSFKKQKHK